MKKESPTESQQNQILKWLQEGNSLTALEALKKFNCLRLAARCSDLKHLEKIDIVTEMIYDPVTEKRYASYRIAGLTPPPKKEKAMTGKTIAQFSRAIQEASRPIPSQTTLF